ncbi:MAG TPA: GNAT family N-acetyltransferase [Ohtaekwangia sp.]|uniref:GNAT family N-acetyltransferase n=1 Tax=Ohtaekwangia sp. TaxID=2066019 RepID=UPI002F91E4A6
MITISQAALHDLEALAELFDEYRKFYRHASDLSGARTFLSDRMMHQDSVIYIARSADGAAMGFVQLYPLLSSTRMKRVWLLNDLYVHPDFRGQQVSVGLIDHAKDLARRTGAAALLLETEQSNAIGNNLYRKTGFALDMDHNYYSWCVA